MKDTKTYPNNILELEQRFFAECLAHRQQAMQYGDETAKALARSLLPSSINMTEPGEKLTPALLRWFKLSFFTWVDTLPCEACGAKTSHSGALDPTPDELNWGATRVEGHRCTVCALVTRFPRYNNPVKLLETRRGRCGEWANAFTLVAGSVGLEARIAFDDSDHVWTEIWCPKLGRWVHADACEAAFDTPLVYEQGWGKKLAYVIAFSPTEVVDVSWRYSRDHAAMLGRRHRVRETALVTFLHNLRESGLGGLGVEERRRVDVRLLGELVELMGESRETKKDEMVGRSSGDVGWREMRGELGKIAKSPRTIKPTPEELASGQLQLTYDIVKDEYSRNGRMESGLHSCAFSADGVERKEELDWRMAYLARQEGRSSEASISWRMDLTELGGKAVERVSAQLHQTTFENGSILATLCAGDACARVPKEGSVVELKDGVRGAKRVEVKGVLSGGSGNSAWQHAQLLRSSLTDPSQAHCLVITVSFVDA